MKNKCIFKLNLKRKPIKKKKNQFKTQLVQVDWRGTEIDRVD